MSHKAARIGVTSVVLVLAFAGLLYSTMGESLEYYKKVDEVMVNPQQWHGKALQLHGFAQNVGRKRDSLDWQFDIHSNGKVVRAYYTGVTPDTFKEDSEVVVRDGSRSRTPSRPRRSSPNVVEVRARRGQIRR